ncbi:MAG: restriction endonuclease subunit S [Pseudomonadales bacterium]
MSIETDTMKKKSKRSLTPIMRFPEFRDSPEWVEKSLSEITSVIFDGTHQTPTYTEAGIPFYSVENLISGNANKFISREDYDLATRNNKPEKGDILLTRIGKIGFSQVVTWEHEFSVYVTLAVIKGSSQFDSGYLHCLLQSDFYQSELRSKSLSNAVPPKINMDTLRETKVLLPAPSEQQKIADCLVSLDGLIAAEGQKLAALRDQKRGLMQQLFPQPGQTQPPLRFPEFRNKGNWVECELAELLPIGSSKRVHQRDWASDGVPFYRAREIVAIHNGEKISPLYISENLYDENIAKTGAISRGDLLVTGVGSIGVPYLVNSSDRFYFKDGNIVWLKNDESQVIGRFLHLLYQTPYVQSQIAKMAGVGPVGTYTIDNAKRTQIAFPCDLTEQCKVADCLGTLDTQITAQVAKTDALKKHKKGLMQVIFPAPKEQ